MWLEQVPLTITATVAGPSIPAPASLQSISSIAYLSGTTGYDLLVPAPIAQVRMDAAGTYIGYPGNYALLNSVIYLDCNIAVGARFDLIYKARTPDSIAATVADPPATLGDKQAAILACACADIALGYLKNADEAGRHEARFQQFLQILMDEEDEKRGDVHGEGIVPDTALYFAAFGYGRT